MFVLIVGGGVIGEALAVALLNAGEGVCLVEKDRELAKRLKTSLRRANTVHGDGDEPAVLEIAGVSHADVMAAMTDDDEDNLVACLLARREYGIGSTYARINDHRNEWLFSERFGVDRAIRVEDFDAEVVAREIVSADAS